MLSFARAVVRSCAAVALAGASAGAQGVRPNGTESPPAPAAAAPTAAPVDSATLPTALVPRADAATTGVRPLRSHADPSPVPSPRRADTSQNRALMIVGGAGLLVGAIIGGRAGTIIMVGGGVIGLYGLYKFLE